MEDALEYFPDETKECINSIEDSISELCGKIEAQCDIELDWEDTNTVANEVINRMKENIEVQMKT